MTRPRLFLVLAAAAVLGGIAYQVQIHNLHVVIRGHGPFTTPARATAIVVFGFLFVVAGVVAWRRRPENMLGMLMAAAGFALLLRQLRYSHEPALFTVFFPVGELAYWLVAQAVFSYPVGRITDRYERALIVTGYTVTAAFTVAILLVYDGDPTKPLRFFEPRPRKSLLLVAGNGDLAVALQKAFVIVVWGVLAVAAIALLIRKLVRATPRGRRMLAPLIVMAIAVALRAVWESVFTFFRQPTGGFADYLFWWQIAAFVALPISLLVWFLRTRLARANVGDLVLELGRTPSEGVRDALARALDDPMLEVAFWLPERQIFVDATGQEVELPENDRTRAVTRLDHDREPVAALIHDPSLLDEPKLVSAAGAAAMLSLENARLQADVRSQLAEVQESRRRIVTAGDERARQIERDLHDGAQQRLVALALELRIAQRQLGKELDPEVERLLEGAVGELQVAVDELRELARGVHPAVLTEEGLAGAIESLATRTPIPVRVSSVADERLPSEIEAAAYFVVCEAIANAVKHSQATRVSVSAERVDGRLVVAVEDDGVGGADATAGTGLRGLVDRVEAHGGTLRIESAAGRGTRVVGELPCAS
jgi:signal transduction histidine kinase